MHRAWTNRAWIRRLAVAAVALPVLSGSLLAGSAAAAVTGGGNPPPVTPPSNGGGGGDGQSGGGSSNGNGTYTAQVAQQITLSGDVNSGGYDTSTYTPPACWLQPEFLQPQTYQAGDPSGGPSDADSFWFWYGRHFPNFNEFLHGTGAFPDINQEFQQEQNMQPPGAWTGPNPITASDVWWAPNWLQTDSGFACAQGLVAASNLSDGFLGMSPPATPGAGGPTGAITSQQLSELARAALKLPTVTVVTSPPATQPARVNVPTYVSVNYDSNPEPADEAEIDYQVGGLFLWAKVQASRPSVQISTDAPAGTYSVASDGTCAATAGGQATSACTVTFRNPTPSTQNYTITATVTWTVTWQTSAGDGGTFPAATHTGTTTMQVQEIQTKS